MEVEHTQCQKRFVNIGPLPQPDFAPGHGRSSSFRPSQINHGQFGHLDLGIGIGPLLQIDLKHGVRSGRLGVGVGGMLGSVSIAEGQESKQMICAVWLVHGQAGNSYTVGTVFADL